MLLADALDRAAVIGGITCPRHLRRAHAEDAAAGAQGEVWRSWTGDPGRREVDGWARRGAIDELRRLTGWRRQHRPHVELLDDTAWRRMPAVDDVAGEVAARVDALAEFARLDPVSAEVVRRHGWGDRLAAIGADHGVTESRMSQRLTMARRQLWQEH